MSKSLTNFKFYKSFRIKVEEADKIALRIMPLEGVYKGHEIATDIEIKDLNLFGLSFTSKIELPTGSKLKLIIYNKRIFNKWDIDVEGIIIRSYTSDSSDKRITYGVNLLDQSEDSELKYFIKDFISRFSSRRLKDYLISSALSEKSISTEDGIELYSLLLSLFLESEGQDQQRSLDWTSHFLKASEARIYRINLENDKLENILSSNDLPQMPSKDFREGYAGKVFTTQSMLNLNLKNTKEEINLEPDREIESIMAIPLYNRFNKVVGVLEFLNKIDYHFTIYDEQLISFMASIFSKFLTDYNPSSKSSMVIPLNPELRDDFIYLGSSKKASKVRSTIKKIKNSNDNVMIVGEYGLGKKFLAKTIHQLGKLAKYPLQMIDCSDTIQFEKLIRDNIQELELETPGSIVLLNVDRMDIKLQKDFFTQIQFSNKRFISVSEKELSIIQEKNLFYKKLYTRLTTAYIHIPPLRIRKDDIVSIAQYLVDRECRERDIETVKLSELSKKQLVDYHWPKNISQLEKTVKKAVMKYALNDEEFQLDIPEYINEYENIDVLNDIEKLIDFSDKSIPLDKHLELLKKSLKIKKVS